MTHVLLAVTASEAIEKVGSYAGVAAIVGLGVLALLYFAQAREVKRLREWAGRAPERAVELGQRVQAEAQRRVVAQPLAPATTAAQQAEAARTAAAAGPKTAGPVTPAPVVAPPGQLARPAPAAQPGAGTVPPAPAVNAATTAPPGGASAPAAPGAPATPGTPAAPAAPAAAAAPGAPAAPVPPAATAAAAARQTATPSRVPDALGNGSGGQETHESAAARPEPPIVPPPSGPARGRGGRRFSAARVGAAIAGGVAVVVVAAVVTMTLTGGEDATQPNDFGSVTQPSAPPAGQGASTTAAAAGVDRRATRVAVLNGTTQTGLARAVADEVEKARFTIAGTENNADQAVPTTTVSYRPGNERAAQIVAQVLRIQRSSVRPVDANTSAAADADVIVIVGADKIG